MKETPLSELTYAHFAAQRQSKFLIRSEREPSVELELVQADLQPNRSSFGAAGRMFFAGFCGPGDTAASAGHLAVSTPCPGKFFATIVPISGDRERTNDEAIFNRRAPG